MSDPITTAFHAVQEARGATFMEEGGWLWSESFGDPAAEYARRARRRRHVGRVAAQQVGLPRARRRRGGATRPLQRHPRTRGRAGPVRRVPGRGRAARRRRDGIQARRRSPVGHDERHGARRVLRGGDEGARRLGRATSRRELPNLQIQGPRSRELLRTLTDVDVDALRYFRFIPDPVTVGGVPVWLSRTGFSGELGFELFLRPEHAADLWDAVEAAGATPYGVEVIEPLRVETGMVVTDYDYAAHERTPFDLGMDRVVALDAAAEFMGKERLREIAADPPNRFKTLRVEGDTLPEYGAVVTRDGEEVGVLTSPALSPKLGNIGLAILRTDVAADGSRGRRRARRRHRSCDGRRRRALRPAEAPPEELAHRPTIRSTTRKGRTRHDRRRTPLTVARCPGRGGGRHHLGGRMAVGHDRRRHRPERVRGDPFRHGSVGPLLHDQVRGHGAGRGPADPAPVHERPVGRGRRPGALRGVRQRRRAHGRRRQRLQALGREVLGHDQHRGPGGLVPRDGRRPGRADRRTHRGAADDLGHRSHVA